ncbi:MAG: ABC transporter permease [Bacteroidia bacterium]|nr:ABC transporter permease [Bacteroidia bacterium]NND25779.1 ABC transporter permease [Flavobacteriaceae bacterium]MBT8277401.1 ABC transporter permease [Bacteroidia bacterium]NNK59691.1 ABC transporter permease [Flavobacteriaceae bacterium]NNL32653.1 ABC transporter permease [Flavobacteriaceae bacterium]
MNFSFYIAKRYLLSKSNNNAINFIAIIAAFGVIIGSAALFIVLSGFAGLKDFTLEFSNYVDPDLKMIPAQGKSFRLSSDQINTLNNTEGVASYAMIIEERVIISYEEKNEAVLLKGVDDNFPQKTIDSILSHGRWFDNDINQVVAGWGVANNLSFGIMNFEKAIKIYVPKPGQGQITSLKSAFNSIAAINVGVFQINEELDNSYVFTNLETARMLLNYEEDQFSGVEIILSDKDQINTIKSDLENTFGDQFIFKDREQLNDALYKMLNTENLAVYLIFTLILIIALFNVIGSIIMMILDKKKNLNTLFNLGVTVKQIRKIFFLQGSLMSVIGGIIGVTLGFLLVLVQKTFGFVLITPSLPYPVSIKWMNVLLVLITISVLGILASKIASSRISKQLVQTV